MCKHWECPYRYCPYHQNYDKELEVIYEWVIPDMDEYRDCVSYLDA
jgi:hypothetical protein